MYSTLLAQIEADNMFPGRPMNKRKEWHDKYQDVLHNLGWVNKSFRYVVCMHVRLAL